MQKTVEVMRPQTAVIQGKHPFKQNVQHDWPKKLTEIIDEFYLISTSALWFSNSTLQTKCAREAYLFLVNNSVNVTCFFLLAILFLRHACKPRCLVTKLYYQSNWFMCSHHHPIKCVIHKYRVSKTMLSWQHENY